MKKVFVFGFGALVLGFLGWPIGYILAARSEAFRVANEYVSSNIGVIQQIGIVKSTRLCFLGYSMKWNYEEGFAKLCIVTKGEGATANVYVDMQLVDSQWNVEGARLTDQAGQETFLSGH